MGYLHNITLENGFKINYSLFYKYDNFLNKLRSCNYLFEKNTPYTKVEGKENLTFGIDFSYKFKNIDFINSVNSKIVVNEQGVKASKTLNLCGIKGLFESVNVTWKANVKYFFNFPV